MLLWLYLAKVYIIFWPHFMTILYLEQSTHLCLKLRWTVFICLDIWADTSNVEHSGQGTSVAPWTDAMWLSNLDTRCPHFRHVVLCPLCSVNTCRFREAWLLNCLWHSLHFISFGVRSLKDFFLWKKCSCFCNDAAVENGTLQSTQ